MTSCPSLSHENNYQEEHQFPANFLCRVMKRLFSTALGLVSRLFRSRSLPPLILNVVRKLVIFKFPTQPKPQICYLFSTQWWNLITATQKNKFGNSHVTNDVITLYVTWEDILWQVLSCCGSTFFYVKNRQSYKAFKKTASKDSGIIFMIIIIYFNNYASKCSNYK